MNDLSILLLSKLDLTESAKTINSQLPELQKQLNKLNLKVDINPQQLKVFGDTLKQVQSQAETLNRTMSNIGGNFSKQSTTFNANGEETKKITEYTNAIGQSEKVITQAGQHTATVWTQNNKEIDKVKNSLILLQNQAKNTLNYLSQKHGINLDLNNLQQAVKSITSLQFDTSNTNLPNQMKSYNQELQNSIKLLGLQDSELKKILSDQKKQAELLAKIDKMRSTYGDSVFNQFKVTGLNKLITDIISVTKDTKSLSSVFDNLQQRLNKLDLKMSSLSKIRDQVGKIEGFGVKYSDKINQLKIDAVLNPASISKIEQQFLKLQDKMKNALSSGDTKAFNKYIVEVARLKRNVDDLYNTQKKMQSQSDANLNEEIRAYRLKNQELAKSLILQKQIRLEQESYKNSFKKFESGSSFGVLNSSQLSQYNNLKQQILGVTASTSDAIYKLKLFGKQFDELKIKSQQGFNFKNLSNDITNFQTKYTTLMSGLTGKYGSLVDSSALNKFKTDLQSLSTSTPDVTNKMKQMALEFQNIKTNAQNSSAALRLSQKDATSFADAIGQIVQKFSLWIGVSTLVMGVLHKITEAFEYTIEQTKLFTNLQMEMTGQTLNYSEIIRGTYEYAQATGTLSSEVMKAISVFGTYTSKIDEVIQKSQAAVNIIAD